MKPTLTLLALLVAGVINLQAQNPPTPHEQAWDDLFALKKEGAAQSPEGLAIRDALWAQDSLTEREARIIEWVTLAQESKEAFNTLQEAVGTKTGVGADRMRASIKYRDLDLNGWTPGMISARADLASRLATYGNATPEFKALVWAVLKNVPAHSSKQFFKEQRATLSKAEQLEVTQRQKELMLITPQRSATHSAWLAEMSADLIALQLDQ